MKLGLNRAPGRKRRLAKAIHIVEGIFRAGGVEASSARVDVEGRVAGEPRAVPYAVVDRMRRLTATPASIGAVVLARGEIGGQGHTRLRQYWIPGLSSKDWLGGVSGFFDSETASGCLSRQGSNQ